MLRYNISADPLEKREVSSANPQVVATLLARMAQYGASKDQVPPTLFFPFNETAHGIAPWNYQCPQCRQGGGLPGPKGLHFDPWCDDVQCGVGPPAPPPGPAPAPAPTPKCPWHVQLGGMGSGANPDIRITNATGWEDCCVTCMGDKVCMGWTFFTDERTCHLHANDKSQNDRASRITGLRPQ